MWRTPCFLLAAALALSPPTARAADGDAPKDTSAGETLDAEASSPVSAFPPRRYAYVAGGAFLIGGLAFAYAAQGEARRAQTIGSAVEAQNALGAARAAAATSSILYGLAGATVAYALLLELLPEPIASKASLTFHF